MAYENDLNKSINIKRVRVHVPAWNE